VGGSLTARMDDELMDNGCCKMMKITLMKIIIRSSRSGEPSNRPSTTDKPEHRPCQNKLNPTLHALAAITDNLF